MLLDFGPADDPGRAAALDFVLAHARRRDAMTLWHLLTRGQRAKSATASTTVWPRWRRRRRASRATRC